MGDGPTHRRVQGGCHVLIQRPPVENYYGVDRAMQYRLKSPVSRQSRKYWKYFMNFIIEVCLVNTFLLRQATPGVTKPRKHYSLSDALVGIAKSLIGDYSNRKKDRYAGAGAVTAAGVTAHNSVKLEDRPRGSANGAGGMAGGGTLYMAGISVRSICVRGLVFRHTTSMNS